ncbi:MAG TPA: 4a-hydroxytetrahydrobiopterin dehydratase [Thermomicrobiales bacterium]|jgi:4a-hydroxytetrahydrobiopterin dehydratase|nr:4a-hydroxytetrahydrobiopterin dehydratase [Thermomicrobiales bacterium]
MTRINELRRERCKACRKDAPLLLGEELDEMLLLVPDWELQRVDDVPRLVRTFPQPSWRAGLRFTQQLGELAEEEDHHPVILLDWNKVTVSWWTHIIRGLHRNDILMATKTDALAESL